MAAKRPGHVCRWTAADENRQPNGATPCGQRVPARATLTPAGQRAPVPATLTPPATLPTPADGDAHEFLRRLRSESGVCCVLHGPRAGTNAANRTGLTERRKTHHRLAPAPGPNAYKCHPGGQGVTPVGSFFIVFFNLVVDIGYANLAARVRYS